jgi:hypothetical protein
MNPENVKHWKTFVLCAMLAIERKGPDFPPFDQFVSQVVELNEGIESTAPKAEILAAIMELVSTGHIENSDGAGKLTDKGRAEAIELDDEPDLQIYTI